MNNWELGFLLGFVFAYPLACTGLLAWGYIEDLYEEWKHPERYT